MNYDVKGDDKALCLQVIFRGPIIAFRLIRWTSETKSFSPESLKPVISRTDSPYEDLHRGRINQTCELYCSELKRP